MIVKIRRASKRESFRNDDWDKNEKNPSEISKTKIESEIFQRVPIAEKEKNH